MLGKYCIILMLFLMSVTAPKSFSQENGSISAQAFGSLPEIISVQISPDGSKILMLKNVGGQIIIVTRSLDDEARENTIPNDEGAYNWAIWASNERILASIRFVGHENRSQTLKVKLQRRLLSMSWDGKDMINPNRFRSRGRTNLRFTSRQPQNQDHLIDILKDDPDHVLVQMDIDKENQPGVYKLNIKSKKRTRVLMGRRSVDFWMTDPDHVVRYGEGITDVRRKNEVLRNSYYRKSLKDSWQTLFKYNEINEKRPFYFEGFSKDPSIIYITADDENAKRSLFTYNVDSGQRIEKIAGDGRFDIVDVAIGDDYELDYYSYYHERPEVIRLSERGKILDGIFNELFPGKSVSVESKTRDENKLIITVSSPTTPASFYYLDVRDKSLKKIGQAYENIDQSKLSDKKPVSYSARDGVDIHGYLSLPKGAADKNLATVILPHGGPMARDGWGFDYLTQFLTTRGYAVFQMNFRGSTGYGEEFRMMGYHEWGRKMLYDINDGTRWMIEQGYADPDKICIMGGSYGGYAALQSIVMDEIDYRCSVAFAPITHLPRLLQNFKGITGFEFYKSYIESDQWTLDAASPSYNIDKISVPVLIFHGTKDMNVPIGQSRSFNSRMKKIGKDIKYIEFEDGDHFMSDEKHRTQFLTETAAFLNKHLK